MLERSVNKLSGANWHKSTRSATNSDCVEVAENLDNIVAIRDTKNRDKGTLIVGDKAWTDFIEGVKAGEFDL